MHDKLNDVNTIHLNSPLALDECFGFLYTNLKIRFSSTILIVIEKQQTFLWVLCANFVLPQLNCCQFHRACNNNKCTGEA